MARSFRLEPVLALAQRRLESATAELQKLAQRRADTQSRLDQLLQFLADYRQQYRAALHAGLDQARMQDFRAFLAKLERAVDLQNADVRRCQEAWSAKHSEWLDLRQREQAMNVLKDRHRAAELARDGKREQKQQDEFAGRRILGDQASD
ncbi:MAG: flagellar export protein FliJ [Burkholderiales bacterium]|nr:flagellar export protein FliJ [Burkholderiales bacterium]